MQPRWSAAFTRQVPVVSSVLQRRLGRQLPGPVQVPPSPDLRSQVPGGRSPLTGGSVRQKNSSVQNGKPLLTLHAPPGAAWRVMQVLPRQYDFSPQAS